MALPGSIRDREYNKFCDTGDPKETAVRVCADDNLPITGTINISGLSKNGLNTTLTVGTNAVPLPATALVDRNALSIRNLDTNIGLYIGFDTGVTATQTNGTASGWLIGPSESYNVDITNNIVVYGIATQDIQVQVQELA